jgi:threonine dehydrogenase-like Zn-dependent dehydrogenase
VRPFSLTFASRTWSIVVCELVLKDVTAVGVLSGSGALAGTVDLYASGAVDPRPLVAATVALEDAATVLAGNRPPEWGTAPKIHIDAAGD